MCVFILCAPTRLQSDIIFWEPSLRSIELSQPPVVPLLQHTDDVTLREAQHRTTGVRRQAGLGFWSGRPRRDGSGKESDRQLGRDNRQAARISVGEICPFLTSKVLIKCSIKSHMLWSKHHRNTVQSTLFNYVLTPQFMTAGFRWCSESLNLFWK